MIPAEISYGTANDLIPGDVLVSLDADGRPTGHTRTILAWAEPGHRLPCAPAFIVRDDTTGATDQYPVSWLRESVYLGATAPAGDRTGRPTMPVRGRRPSDEPQPVNP